MTDIHQDPRYLLTWKLRRAFKLLGALGDQYCEQFDISAAERFEIQVNFFKRNPKVDILGSNILIFNDQMFTPSTGKIISYPTLDKLIKFNLLFSCCLAHPSIMFRVSSIGS